MDEEIESWHGPAHYITTFVVVKPDSISTKTRVVSNSALRNVISKLSLNDCMWPGPNALCDLLDCLIFWRSVEVAIIMDLRKAYQVIHTSDMELHLRRFMFRRSPHDPWRTYGFTRATFGDLTAGLMLEVAKRRFIDLGAPIDPIAAKQLNDFTYVDDSVLGGKKEDVDRMRGTRDGGIYSGTVAQILSKGAMTVKFMAVMGSNDPVEESQLGGKNLGVGYKIREDVICFQLRPCYHSGKPASSDVVRQVTLLGPKEVAQLRKGVHSFTRRQALSMVMGVYDPLGLLSLALILGKILLRRLYAPEVVKGWDQELPTTEKKLWGNWFTTLLETDEITFPRLTHPLDAVGPPRLAGFCDASMLAVSVAVYVVWKNCRGEPISRILMGKCCVAPLLGLTIPRGELQLLTILHHLVLVIVEAFPVCFASI